MNHQFDFHFIDILDADDWSRPKSFDVHII